MNTDTPAIELIAAERARQISAEGWTPEHDDAHDDGELSKAAQVYTECGRCTINPLTDVDALKDSIIHFASCESPWPWEPEWLKISPDPVRNLVKAAALIVAEIERLQRLKPTGEEAAR